MRESADKAQSKRGRVIAAASMVFRRFGYTHSSMNAIAEAADISRPGLYLMFPSKQHVFEAAVEYMGDRALAALRAGLPSQATLAQKLVHVCSQWAVGGYERAKEFPDAKDLTDPSLPAVQAVYRRFEALLVDIMREARGAGASSPTLSDVAHLLALSLRGFKEGASHSDELQRMIALQVTSLLATLHGAHQSARRRAKLRSVKRHSR
jgi:AcrR family transcriptional regulator